jgi:hypothetical protein
VRVPAVHPAIDCDEIEVAGVGIGRREAARKQVPIDRIKIGKLRAEPAGCLLAGNITRINAIPHTRSKRGTRVRPTLAWLSKAEMARAETLITRGGVKNVKLAV